MTLVIDKSYTFTGTEIIVRLSSHIAIIPYGACFIKLKVRN